MTAYRIPVQPITAPKRPRQHNGNHLDFIRSLPCCVCRDPTSTEAAHIRFSAEFVGKRQTGKGEKPSDMWTVPLCGRCHRVQHDIGEEKFWSFNKQRALLIALALWAHTGQHEVGEQIVRAPR